MRQTRLMNSANILPVLVDFFREFRSSEFRHNQQVLYQRLPECSPDVGLYGLPDDVRRPTIATLHYYDNLGAMVAYKLVAPGIVLGILGESIDRFWSLVEPFLRTERKIRGDSEYEIFFEHMAALAAKAGGHSARAKLSLLRHSSDIE
jgi:hypothetical protein